MITLKFYVRLPRMNFLIRLTISSLAVLVTAYLLPGVYLENFLTAVVVAVVLGCLNTVLKPLLVFLSLPAVIFSFGLFLVVINTLMIMLADTLVDGFSVGGFWHALLFGIMLSMVTGILNAIKRNDEQTN